MTAASQDWAAWDAQARSVAQLAPQSFAALVDQSSEKAAAELLLARWRWRLDEFAQVCMGRTIAGNGPLSPPNEVDDLFYAPIPERRGRRTEPMTRLVLAGRGFGKTTRQKIRAFHGLIYGIREVSATIAANDTDAIGWTDTIRSWCEDPPPLLQFALPDIEVSGNAHQLDVTSRFGRSHLLARGFDGRLRGLNVRGKRPDALDLDDIENEDNEVTEQARDKVQAKVQAKILPLVPIEGGAEIWWVQTPIHHDCVAVRAFDGGKEELGAWDARRLPVLRRWPDRKDLWEQARRMYFDVAEYGDRPRAARAALTFYLDNRVEMDRGADVLDSVRMGPWRCHQLVWDLGQSVFRREFLVETGVVANGLLQPDKWPRWRWASRMAGSESVIVKGKEVSISELALEAHYDPSDGGDDGALVIAGHKGGRMLVFAALAMRGMGLSQQIPQVVRAVASWAPLGLKCLQWEPPPGAASLAREHLRNGLSQAGLRITIVDKPSSEHKETRIANTLEPLGSGGLLCLPEDCDPRIMRLIAQFDPGKTNQTDDVLDALQRCAERMQSASAAEVAQAARSALRSLRGGR